MVLGQNGCPFCVMRIPNGPWLPLHLEYGRNPILTRIIGRQGTLPGLQSTVSRNLLIQQSKITCLYIHLIILVVWPLQYLVQINTMNVAFSFSSYLTNVVLLSAQSSLHQILPDDYNSCFFLSSSPFSFFIIYSPVLVFQFCSVINASTIFSLPVPIASVTSYMQISDV